MWDAGHHCADIDPEEVLQSLSVSGNLERSEASAWFVKFLADNPGFASSLLIGSKLATLHPIQDIILRSWFIRDYNLIVAGRGFSKSYMAAVFITLYALLYPGSNIIICAGAFRQSKGIFDTVEKFIRKSPYLSKCLTREPKHGTDCYEMELGESSIKALPLTEKIRGYRANLVVIDEYLNVTPKIVKEVIIPFITVQRGGGPDERKIREDEDKRIKEGRMKEWERTKFPQNKLIGLSSATYQCEPLYKDVYLNYINLIQNPDPGERVSHSLWRLSYEAGPANFFDASAVAEAKRTLSRQQFDKEYRGLFPSDSGGFFNIQDIIAAQIGEGQNPCIKLRGDPGKKYIMGFDPTFSAGSEEADDFAICLIELDEETQAGTLVHCYAMPKSNVKNRALYFQYLFNFFNIVYVAMDHMGGPKFIETVLAILPEFPKPLKLMEDPRFDTPEEIRETRRQYNYSESRIIHSVIFQQNMWKRRANECLQTDLQHKRVFFGSSSIYGDMRTVNMNVSIPIEDLEFKEFPGGENAVGKEKQFALCDHLNDLVEQTKTELSFIQMTSNTNGNIDFHLPQKMKRATGPDRPRRDLYTALLLANWGRQCYFQLLEQPEEEGFGFTPILYGGF